MGRVNWEGLKDLARGGDWIAHQYEDEHGRRCFIGQLAYDGGYRGIMRNRSAPVDALPKLAAAAMVASGLTLEELVSVQRANDWAVKMEDRRKELHRMLSFLEGQRGAGVAWRAPIGSLYGIKTSG